MILPWFLVAVSWAVSLTWLALAVRSLRHARRATQLHPSAAQIPLARAEPIDAVVPAHNEEAHIRDTVEQIAHQNYPRLRLIVVDDQSTDRTAAILNDLTSSGQLPHPCQVVHGEARPDGWVGKTWAVHQGVKRSEADWLWFVDADMGLHPSALTSALELAHSQNADLVTLAPQAVCTTFWQSVMALTLTHLLGHLYPPCRVNDPADPLAMAVGGFILIRRSAYEQAGGHEAVRSEIVDDINLARRVKQAGGRLVLAAAPKLAWTHMYGSFSDIWRGLRKNAYAGMDYLPHKLVVGSLAALVMVWTPSLALLAGGLGLQTQALPALPTSLLLASGALGVLFQALSAAPFALFLKLGWGYLATVPIGLTAYVAIAAASAWHYHRGRVLWKDRAFVAPPSRPRDPRL